MEPTKLRASELRIGNLFSLDGEPIVIVGLKPFGHSCRCDESEGCQVIFDELNTNRKAWECDLDDIKPIELTEEWVKRAGFYKRNETSSVYKLDISEEDESTKSTLQWWIGTEHVSVCRSGINAKSVPIKYVHQLQNLYFALTGSELTIKEQ